MPEFSLRQTFKYLLSEFPKRILLEDKVLFIKHFVDIIVGIIEKVKEDFTTHISIITQ